MQPCDQTEGDRDGHGRYGVLDQDDRGWLLCHECGHWWRHLAAHVRAHGLHARDYRAAHGLPATTRLVGPAWEASRGPETAEGAAPRRTRLADEPAGVSALAARLLARELAEPDPIVRYALLSRAGEAYDQLVSRIAWLKARCAAELHISGGGRLSHAGIAEALQVSRGRAQQLVERARPRPARQLNPSDTEETP